MDAPSSRKEWLVKVVAESVLKSLFGDVLWKLVRIVL